MATKESHEGSTPAVWHLGDDSVATNNHVIRETPSPGLSVGWHEVEYGDRTVSVFVHPDGSMVTDLNDILASGTTRLIQNDSPPGAIDLHYQRSPTGEGAGAFKHANPEDLRRIGRALQILAGDDASSQSPTQVKGRVVGEEHISRAAGSNDRLASYDNIVARKRLGSDRLLARKLVLGGVGVAAVLVYFQGLYGFFNGDSEGGFMDLDPVSNVLHPSELFENPLRQMDKLKKVIPGI